MTVFQLHNFKRFGGGDSVVFEATCRLLSESGVDVLPMVRDSRMMNDTIASKFRAFFSSIYSIRSRREIQQMLVNHHPDVVHVHNLYPFLSASVLLACHEFRVPVLYHAHSYRLTCPFEYHLKKGAICDACAGGREYMCLFFNCRGNWLESAAYALQNRVARFWDLQELVSRVIVPSDFCRNWLIARNWPGEKVVTVPNPVSCPQLPVAAVSGDYVAFAGRFSPEKGINTLVEATRLIGLPLHMAGDFRLMARELQQHPHLTLRGSLNRDEMGAFYRGARFLVVPSVWNETFGLVATEAMSHGLPVIASRIGGLAEIIVDGETGLLVSPGDVSDLAEKIAWLWEHPQQGREMGIRGRERVNRDFSPRLYKDRLMAVYRDCVDSKEMQ